MTTTTILIGLILTIALGPSLGNWDQKRSQMLHACCIAATCVILGLLDGWGEVVHFHMHETIPSIAMVFGILPVLVFRFKVVPKTEVALFVYLAILTPIISNLFTSLAVLPMVVGVWSFLSAKYGREKAALVAMTVLIFCSNFLAVFSYQADLPTTEYGRDLANNEQYTENREPFEILRPVGIACYGVYILILFCLGISIRGKKEVKYRIEGVQELFSAAIICAVFIGAMKMHRWEFYLLSPVVGYLICFYIDRGRGGKHIHHLLSENIRETGLLFGAIFGFISLMPLAQISQSFPKALPFITGVLTLFTDNLIAYVATCEEAFKFGWIDGIKSCLLVSIMFGGHFLLGHAALIVFFLGFLPKEWKISETEDTGRDFGSNTSGYLWFILKMNLRLSFLFLPMTLILVMGAGNAYLMALGFIAGAVPGGIVTHHIFGSMYPKKKV